MSLLDIKHLKDDLYTFTSQELLALQRYYGIPDATHRDLLWLLAINILQNKPIAHMDHSASLLFAGDIMLGRSFNQIFSEQNIEYPWGDTLPLLQNSDGLIANLETTITNSDEKWPDKAFNYKLFPQFAGTLKLANIGYLSLANNHILDYQTPGLRDTVKTLRELDIPYAGVGDTLAEASKPSFVTIAGIKFAFLSAADHYSYWDVRVHKPGIWYIPIRSGHNKMWDYALERVTQVKKNCDFLIFSLHWNWNYVDQIEPQFKQFAHLLIDHGVSIIHGHSPHHLLPIEEYHQGIIFYSLGDFIDDYAVDQYYRSDLGMLAQVKFSKQIGATLETIYPTIIKDYQVNLATGQQDIATVFSSTLK